jgi:hypothetical protein
MQKLLILETYECDLNTKVVGWTNETGRIITLFNIPISQPVYQTPMHAINDGWRLLSPPVAKYTDTNYWQWWFEK